MKLFIIFAFIILASNSFADKLIIHELTSDNISTQTKVFVSYDYIKIENEEFALIYDRNQQGISLYSIKAMTYLHTSFKDYKSEYYDFAMMTLERLKITEVARNEFLKKIASDSAIITKDSIEVFDYKLNTLKQKKKGKKKILDYKCQIMVYSNDSGEVAKLYFSDKLINESLIDLQYAWKVFRQITRAIGDKSLISYEYFATQKKLKYPMNYEGNNGITESVVIAEDYTFKPDDIEINPKYLKLSLFDFILSLKDSQQQ